MNENDLTSISAARYIELAVKLLLEAESLPLSRGESLYAEKTFLLAQRAQTVALVAIAQLLFSIDELLHQEVAIDEQLRGLLRKEEAE